MPSDEEMPDQSLIGPMNARLMHIEAMKRAISNKKEINDALIEHAKPEATLRESSISIKIDSKLEQTTIERLIQTIWVNRNSVTRSGSKNYPVRFWSIDAMLFCQFVDKQTKDSFLDYANSFASSSTNGSDHLSSDNNSAATMAANNVTGIDCIDGDAEAEDVSTATAKNVKNLIDNLVPKNYYGHHFTRKPVRVEIPSVESCISFDNVKKFLTGLASLTKAMFTDIKEGNVHKANQARSILFKSDANGIQVLFGMYYGILPFTDKDLGTRHSLYVRINCKPYICKYCHRVGKHGCAGKSCTNCGSRKHLTQDCKRKTHYCVNCKKPGHRAKDARCPNHIKELIRELKRIDLPIEILNNYGARQNLIKQIRYK